MTVFFQKQARATRDTGILKTASIHNSWPIAREGLPFLAAGAAGTLILSLGGLSVAALVAGILTGFSAYFFRDPERTASGPQGAVFTPADGTVIGVRLVEGAESPLEGPALKVSIFMSIFNVHVNRAPATGVVRRIMYRPGRFFSAHLDKASTSNESNHITLDVEGFGPIVFVQIAGFIARRIVCWIQEGDRVEAGQRFGLIRFGSRLDLYLPPGSRIVVKERQKVRAGETIIGYLT